MQRVTCPSVARSEWQIPAGHGCKPKCQESDGDFAYGSFFISGVRQLAVMTAHTGRPYVPLPTSTYKMQAGLRLGVEF
jgi:hypothetical protein